MLLLSTSSLAGYGLHKVFLLAKEAKYDGIDLVIDFDQYDTCNAEYIASLVEISGVKVESISAPERRVTKKQVDEVLAIAGKLGVSLVNLHPPHRLDKEKDWFGEYLTILEAKYPNITIAVTNAPPKTWLFIISEYGDARPETIKKITSHTALSIGNVEPESGIDLMKTFTLLGNTINHVYLTDKTEEKNYLFPGEGNMPLESLLIRMKESGYNGPFTLLVNADELSAGEDEQVIKRLQEARSFLERYY
ncbi:MAG: TIM barrel protein [Candidatus Gracilibacteria bacterium]|nr:TIM barrel protein [Candidatus Gracilibacteria bacterium]